MVQLAIVLPWVITVAVGVVIIVLTRGVPRVLGAVAIGLTLIGLGLQLLVGAGRLTPMWYGMASSVLMLLEVGCFLAAAAVASRQRRPETDAPPREPSGWVQSSPGPGGQ